MAREKKDRGRPKIYQEKMERRDFYMPTSMIDTLRKKSEEKKISMNELVRRIVEYYLKNDFEIMDKSDGIEELVDWTEDDSKILLQLLKFYVKLDYIPFEDFDRIKGYMDLFEQDMIESTKKSILKKLIESLKNRRIGDTTYYDKLKCEHPEASELFRKISIIIQDNIEC